jgi:hypothetical protein
MDTPATTTGSPWGLSVAATIHNAKRGVATASLAMHRATFPLALHHSHTQQHLPSLGSCHHHAQIAMEPADYGVPLHTSNSRSSTHSQLEEYLSHPYRNTAAS